MNFFQIVYNLVRQIPAGKVATYGQIALLAGSPHAARQVGYALRALGLNEENIPWWRVVNREGYLSINHGNGGVEKEIQKNLLEVDGVVVSSELQVDVAQYLWEADSN